MRIMLGEKFIALLNAEDAIPLLIRLNLGLKLIGIEPQFSKNGNHVGNLSPADFVPPRTIGDEEILPEKIRLIYNEIINAIHAALLYFPESG